MDEATMEMVIRTSVRHAFRLGADRAQKSPAVAQQTAVEYAIQLIMPTAVAMAEQAREEGYQHGRAAGADVVEVVAP